MIFSLGKIRLRIHGLLPVFWLISLATGGKETLFSSLAALLLHEAGHMIMARLQKIPVGEIEITPYGGIMTLKSLSAASPLSAFLIAFSGPFFSFLGCFLSGLIARFDWVSHSFALHFARNNLLLLLINLLPVFPLDGGRMLSELLSLFFSRKKIAVYLTAAGYLMGILLIGLSFLFAFHGEMAFAPAFSGLYLIYAAAIERKSAPFRYISSLIGRRQRLEGEDAVPVQWIAAAANLPAERLLGRLQARKMHVILVVAPDGMKMQGFLTEKDLCEAVIQNPSAPLESIIKKEQDIFPAH